MNKKFNISIDKNAKTLPTDFSWQFGIGNDHAFQLLRTDVCEHIKLAHDELGFRYIRFHGIFCDDMLVIQTLTDLNSFKVLPNADKIQETSFKQVAVALDNVIKCGYKPFLELSFMPKALASGDATGLRYKNNTTMPEDMTKWCAFIDRFVRFLISRYGVQEVESWYFEVWNEPDLPFFFNGSMEDYFALYAATANAIKAVNTNFKVGGPSTSACRWLKEFTDYCDKNQVPYDFVSTHHYPGDAFGNIVSDQDPATMFKFTASNAAAGVDMGDTLTDLFFKPSAYKEWEKGAFIEMDSRAKKIAGDKPLFISEWNSMAVYAAPVHDEKYSAAFVVKSVMDSQNLTDGFMFWCCSDVFEEMFNLGKPFHGSFGIVNNDGIPKPNFWAFKILSRLLPNRLDLSVTHDDVEYNVFTDGKKLQVLVYSQDFDCQKNDRFDVEITLNFEAKKVSKQVIDDKHCNPKAEWFGLGKPDILTPAQVAAIKESTKLSQENQAFGTAEGKTKLEFSISTNDVILFELE